MQDPVEKQLNSPIHFWLIGTAVSFSISWIFYFPIIFVSKIILPHLGINSFFIVLISWITSFVLALGLVWQGWKIFKADKENQ